MQPVGIWKTLSADTISVTLKFGFLQTQRKYSITDGSNSIVDKLYRDAEEWMRETANSYRSGSIVGRYTIYLFRVPATEFTMVPVLQPSDIEQNCLIEIVLVPVEINQYTHALYPCQLNIPTNCSRCTKFIAGFYKQGFRCHKCRTTYHKKCAPFLTDDCPVPTIDGTSSTRRQPNTNTAQLIIINPFITDSTAPFERSMNFSSTTVPIYRASTSTSRENAEVIAPNKIIEKGIFPASIRGSHYCQRFLFRLTISHISITSNLSPIKVAETHVIPSNDNDTIFPLTDIVNLVLTHIMEDRDDVFEIHLQNKTILSVGKKTDSHELQMETAQFYSTIRDQRESLLNLAVLSPSPSPTPSTASSMLGSMDISKTKVENVKRLCPKKSIYGISANEQKDLHEIYSFTGEKIGEGAFGRVVGAYNKATKHVVAVKIIEKKNCGEQEIQQINGEATNLYNFNHINILKLEAYYEREEAVYLVTERMETDLCKYINKKPAGYLDEDISRMIAYQLIVAVRYLHSKNCGHLDIKCENILLSLLKPISGKDADNKTREYPLVKLADFGYSRIIGDNSFRKTRVGTKVYNPPEIYRGTSGYNRLADMWSVGIVLYAALSGTLPYDEKGSERAEEIVRDKKNLFGNPPWNNVSKEAKDLIADKLLAIQVASRITSNDALFDPWFCDFDLFSNLREIERRTKHLMSTRDEKLPSSSTWLTGEREDAVWEEYQEIYRK